MADSEVEAVVADLKSKGEPIYNDEIVAAEPDEDLSSSGNGLSGGYDGETTLFDQAVDLVAREGKASTSFIQRHLSIGYNRAAKIIEEMEKQGIVSAANHVGRREVLERNRRDEGDARQRQRNLPVKEAPPFDLDILYRSMHFVAINKPAGLPVPPVARRRFQSRHFSHLFQNGKTGLGWCIGLIGTRRDVCSSRFGSRH